MKELPDLLRKEWPDREGLGFASIQRNADASKEAPADVAAFIRALPIRRKHEERAEIVRRGLEALESLSSRAGMGEAR